MPSLDDKSRAEITGRTRSWLERAVIGLNLCPFAKAVHTKNQIRYAVCGATTEGQLHQTLIEELMHLQHTDPAETDTTLLIHPFVLTDFHAYNAFLGSADATLDGLKLGGEIQIASFHPDYQFADAAPNDITNYTNRAPYPILHLLRESSVERAVAAFPDAEEIYGRNMETMRRLGSEGWRALMSGSAEFPCTYKTPEK